MLRTATISPLLLLLAQRARARLPTDPDDPWQGLGGFHRETMDPDRTLASWTRAWPAPTQHSLMQAWRNPLLTPSASEQVQPAQIAQAIVPQGPLPASGLAVGDAWVLPWEAGPHGYASSLIDRACAEREAGHQVWLAVPPELSEEAARVDRVQAGLNLGVAWLLLPPTSDEDTAFERGLRAWTRVILQNPQHDQWVGLWAELVERLFLDLAQCGQVSRRSAAPEGWPRCAHAHWTPWVRIVLETWREVWPGPAQVEDVCLGLLQPALAPLAEA